jgi:DNA polymerase I-like protein with 3'-5' exonuclease and polymerase domains
LEAFFEANRTLACDVETYGGNRWLCSLRTIGFGNGDTAMIIPWKDGEWQRYYTADEFEAVKRAMWAWFSSPHHQALFHNLGYDVPVLGRYGFPVECQMECTLQAHHVLHPKGALHRLSFAAGMYLDVPPWKQQHAQDYESEPLEELALYNGRDCRITYKLWDAERAELMAWNMMDAYEYQRNNAILAQEISRNGMYVDQSALGWSYEEWSRKEGGLHNDVFLATGAGAAQLRAIEMYKSVPPAVAGIKIADYRESGWPEGFDLDGLRSLIMEFLAIVLEKEDRKRLQTYFDKLESVQAVTEDNEIKVVQLVRNVVNRMKKAAYRTPFYNIEADGQFGTILHDWQGYSVAHPLNDDGSYSTNKEALYHLRETPVVKSWQEWKEAAKQEKWLRALPVYGDGRVHPLFKTHVIPAGRWSCGDSKSDDPTDNLNAQNIEPRHVWLFRAAPGNKLLSADFSALELRTAAVITGCTNLLEQFRKADAGLDIKLHAQTARLLWPDYESMSLEQQKKLYKLAKTCSFQSLYGGTPESLYQALRKEMPPLEDPAMQSLAEEELRADCESTQKRLKRGWPEVFEAAQGWYFHAMKHGWLQMCYVTGLRYYFPLRDREHVRPTLCANLPVQCTASTIASKCGWALRHNLPSSARIINYIHDDFLVECPEELAPVVEGVMRETLQYHLDGPAGGLRIYAEPEVGDSWKDVK